MGVLTLLLSAFLTGGLGPWLPFQMLGAGWIGLTAGWIPRPRHGDVASRRRLLGLAVFGAVWGLLYGGLLNLYFWPFAAPGLGTLSGDSSLYWSPELGLAETVSRYARFYLVTSFAHDLFRAAGNAALVLALGGPILRTLERYRSRFSWEPWVDEEEGRPQPRNRVHEGTEKPSLSRSIRERRGRGRHMGSFSDAGATAHLTASAETPDTPTPPATAPPG